MDNKPKTLHSMSTLEKLESQYPVVNENIIKVYLDYLSKIKILPRYTHYTSRCEL